MSSMPAAGSEPAPVSSIQFKPLDAPAIAILLVLCLLWGFNQVAVKLALADVPPLLQSALRSVIGTVVLGAWCMFRRIPLFTRDGTLKLGLTIGVLFAAQYLLVFQALAFTTASRVSIFFYLMPFMVVIGTRIFMPADRFSPSQWIGLALSFIGVLIAFGVPSASADPLQMIGDLMAVGGAVFWAAVTLICKGSRLSQVRAEKTMMYQVAFSSPLLALAGWLAGERIAHWPGPQAAFWIGYQGVLIVSITFVIWFVLIRTYSASRLATFIFLTPLFGVAAGHFVLGEPLTPAFLLAVAFVAAGLVLVNRVK